LQCSFRKWGLPRAIQVDNGKPFGDPQRSSVPELALWLIGLGIAVVWSRVRTPKDNASVERMQRTTAAWAAPQECNSLQEVQHRLTAVAQLQREKYTLRRNKGKTRRQLYACLWRNRRTYQSRGFAIEKVYAYLQHLLFVRRVSKSGSFTFYSQSVYIGTSYKNQDLVIEWYKPKSCWKLATLDGKGLGYFAGDNFSSSAIKKLKVCRSRSLTVVKLQDASP
jgi:hypothetical protein